MLLKIKKRSKTVNRVVTFLWNAVSFLRRGMRRILILPLQRRMLQSCGKHVLIEKGCRISYRNVSIKDNSTIAEGCVLMSEKAYIHIGRNCMLAPRVALITGDHRIDIKGKPMRQVTEKEKLPQNDQDIIIEDDVWIGYGAILLKGVHIGRGSVLGAGSVVTKDLPPYSIYTGIPAERLRPRFYKDIP